MVVLTTKTQLCCTDVKGKEFCCFHRTDFSTFPLKGENLLSFPFTLMTDLVP